jgi:hypothetical protein
VRLALCVTLTLAVALGSACSDGPMADPEFGDCKPRPNGACRDQDLRNISLVSADLQGMDFSGSTLSDADFRDADLTGAKFVGATLAFTNFARANLRDADLSGALLFGTNLTDADLEGANTEGAQRCNTVEPDGSYTVGELRDDQGRLTPCGGAGAAATPTTPTRPSSGPPRVEYFRQAEPTRCITDVAGTGIDVEWSIPNANTMTFYVDGIRIETSSRRKGEVRLPFVCNGEPHIVSVQAFGAADPPANAAFSATLDERAPLTNEG